MEGLSAKHPQFQYHIAYLKVLNRKPSTFGLEFQLEYENYTGEFDETNALFSNGENIKIKGLKEGLSFVIDITAGQITSIEFSSLSQAHVLIFEYKENILMFKVSSKSMK